MMKHYFTFLAILFSFSLFAQDVPEVQKSMITKISASWCAPCGTWGWNLFGNLVDGSSDKAMIVASHHSGDFTNATAEAIATNFNVNSQPRFIIGNVDQDVSSGNNVDKFTEITAQIDANFTTTPVANAGLTVTLSEEGEFVITTNTKFFQAASGSYNLAAYIIENGVIGFQSQQGIDAFHKNILRASASTTTEAMPFGELIAEGDIAAGSEFSKVFTITAEDDWALENVEVALVIWEKADDESMQFLNTNATKEFTAPEPTTEPNAVVEIASSELTMDLQPTITSNNTRLSLDVVKNQKDLEITVINQLGQIQSTLITGETNAGTQTFEIGNELSNGVYFVVARIGNQVLTKRFIKQ